VVAGGTGFLGSHVSALLADRGFRVRTYGRRGTDNGVGEHVRGDIHDRQRLRAALRGATHVLHLASGTLPSTSNERPREDVEGNLAGGLAFLDACVEEGVSTVIFPSSGGMVYGPSEAEHLDETAPTDPISSYGITKLAFEKYLALYRDLHGLDYRVLRISNAYGEGQPGDRPQGLIGVSLRRIAADEPITIWGDGSTVRDYVYVQDVAECFLAALRPLDHDAPRVFNVGSGEGRSVREILSLIEEVTGRQAAVTFGQQRSCDADRVVLDIRRVRRLLDWAPQVPIADGIERTWRWVRAREGVRV
jgi:UDP-glucose 4-epimerase